MIHFLQLQQNDTDMIFKYTKNYGYIYYIY